MLDKVDEECAERRQAIAEFCGDGYLSGNAWNAARQRINNYNVLYAGISNVVDEVRAADNKVKDALTSYFGSAEKVSEDEYIGIRDEVQGKIALLKNALTTPGAETPAFRWGIERQIGTCESAYDDAQEMLNKIHDCLSETNGVYETNAQSVSMLDILSRGAKELQSTSFGDDGWSDSSLLEEPTWIADLKALCDSGVDSMDELYRDGQLDDAALQKILDKPAELWTPEEVEAVNALYQEAGKQAVGGDPTLLNRFLNDGYECIDSPHIIENYHTATVSAATYSMRDGFQGFLVSYVAAETVIAYEKSAGGLGDVDRLLASTAQGLLMKGSSFTVSAISGAAGQNNPNIEEELKPDVSIGYNKTEMVKNGDGNDIEYVFTEVTYGHRVNVHSPNEDCRGGFLVMTGEGDINASYSALRDIVAGKSYDNVGKAGAEAGAESVILTVLGTIPGAGSVVDAASLGLDVGEAAQNQRAINESISATNELNSQDVASNYSFYEYGTLVADSDGSGVEVVAPSFHDAEDRAKFEAAYEQYRYDNTNGTGQTYGSYAEWANSKPKGGYDDSTHSFEGQTVTNYDVANNPKELSWMDSAR